MRVIVEMVFPEVTEGNVLFGRQRRQWDADRILLAATIWNGLFPGLLCAFTLPG